MSANQQVAVNFAKATFFSDYRKALLEINIPSLILQCADDIMAPLDVGDYLHAHLRRSTLRQLSAIGHFPQLSAPQEVVKAIQDYLAK
jgi:sigma-B regulation protein RsbQ